MNELHPIVTLAFVGVALQVITVAWVALALLILALLAGAVPRFFAAMEAADDLLVTSIIGLDAHSALRFYELYRGRTKRVGFAFVLALVLGPFGAYAYLGEWGRAALALVTLNGFGAWWIESWFSIPQIVLIAQRRLAENSLAQLPFIMSLEAEQA